MEGAPTTDNEFRMQMLYALAILKSQEFVTGKSFYNKESWLMFLNQ